jgi:hypothetical protein
MKAKLEKFPICNFFVDTFFFVFSFLLMDCCDYSHFATVSLKSALVISSFIQESVYEFVTQIVRVTSIKNFFLPFGTENAIFIYIFNCRVFFASNKVMNEAGFLDRRFFIRKGSF